MLLAALLAPSGAALLSRPGAVVSAPQFSPATAHPAARFSRPGPSRRGRRCPGLRALAAPTAGSWPGCALAAAQLVRFGLSRAACEESGRCGACWRRQVLVCARFFEFPVRTGRLLQLLRSAGRATGQARALAGELRSRPAFCGPGRFSPPTHCCAGRREACIRTARARDVLPAQERLGQPLGCSGTAIHGYESYHRNAGAARAREALGGVFWHQKTGAWVRSALQIASL